MADNTRAMHRAIFDRDVAPNWRNRLLKEITPEDLRALCAKVKDRGAPATAIHVRDIVKQIFAFAILRGEKGPNSAEDVGPASIATFVPKDRALSPAEIRVVLKQLEHVPTLPTIRLGLRLILLTMVRKSELQDAVWDEVDFENAGWSRTIVIVHYLHPNVVAWLAPLSAAIVVPCTAPAGIIAQPIPGRVAQESATTTVLYPSSAAAS